MAKVMYANLPQKTEIQFFRQNFCISTARLDNWIHFAIFCILSVWNIQYRKNENKKKEKKLIF